MSTDEYLVMNHPDCDAMVTHPNGERIFRINDQWFDADAFINENQEGN
jgi:hypothetical protein